MVLDPGVIQRRVVGDEVEHQPQAAVAEPLAEPGQGGVAAQGRMHRVAGDGEPGAGDVLVAQVGQRLLELPPPLGVAPGDALSGRAGLPDAQEPDPVEAQLGQAVQLGVRNVVQGRRPAQPPGQLRQPDAGVDLVQRRITRRCHRHVTFLGSMGRERIGATQRDDAACGILRFDGHGACRPAGQGPACRRWKRGRKRRRR